MKAGPQRFPPQRLLLRRFLIAALALVAASSVFLDYWAYSRAYQVDPGVWSRVLTGTAAAPEQYRVGVLETAQALTRLNHHLALRHTIAMIDFVALAVALAALCCVLTRSALWRESQIALQWAGALGFIVLVQYYLAWLTWYQRPETLTCAMLLALSLCATLVPFPSPWLNVAALLLLGLAHGFTRADVGFAFDVAIAAVCLTPLGRGFALPRWLQLCASLLAAGVAAAVQLYLMRVVYPHANYGGGTVVELLLNLTHPRRYGPFLLFLAPSIWLGAQVVRRRVALDAPLAGMLAGSAFFLLLWSTVGVIEEVRIFLPYAFALAPFVVQAAMSRLRDLTAETSAAGARAAI